MPFEKEIITAGRTSPFSEVSETKTAVESIGKVPVESGAESVRAESAGISTQNATSEIASMKTNMEYFTLISYSASSAMLNAK